jgi:hypothetical protein
VLNREEWLPLARKLDWGFSYTTEEEVFPEVISGRPRLPHGAWKDWEESFKTCYQEYVENQHDKDMAVSGELLFWPSTTPFIGFQTNVTLLHSGRLGTMASVSSSSMLLISKAFEPDNIFDRDTRRKQGYGPALPIAWTYLGVGQIDAGLEWLEIAFSERDPFLGSAMVFPGYDAVRDQPQFKRLAEQLKLPT